MSGKERNIAIDMIKCLALIFVFSDHFLLNANFYIAKIDNWGMYIQIVLRTICMTCVPLFLLVTGYLMNQKKASKRYFINIDRVVVVYFIISLIIYLFRVFYMKESLPLKVGFSEMIGYNSSGYQWYIEMYLGLYLLIPFLNRCWYSLEQKEKKGLLFVLGILVTIPTCFSCLKGIKVLPEWWKGIWPLLYYYIGTYFYEYKIKIKKATGCFTLLGTLFISVVFSIFKSYGKVFDAADYNNYWGWQAAAISVIIFAIVISLDIRKTSFWIKGALKTISNMTLSMFLASYIADKIVYHIVLTPEKAEENWYLYYIPSVAAVLIISLLISYGVQGCYHLYMLLVGKKVRKVIEK